MNRLVSGLFVLLTMALLNGCKFVVNKMAFHPDTQNTIPTDQLPHNVDEIFIPTTDGITIQSYFLKHGTSDKLLIYFHGNAGNISHRMSDLLTINNFGINVLGVGYHGYGKSGGSPSEEAIYLDGHAALNYATQTLEFPTERIILFGRSIGTTVAINTAQDKTLDGLILVTPLTSAKEYASAFGLGLVSFITANAFNNIDKIGRITCPTLVIHGTADRVIPYEMGVRLFDAVTTKKQFATITNAGHNNLSSQFAEMYWPPIASFISHTKQ